MLKKIRDLLGRREKSPETVAAEELGNAVPSPPETPGIEPARPTIHRGPTVIHNPIAIQDLDPDAVKIVRRLVRFDHTAFLVGGCVRDLLLDRRPKDYDIGTSATPRQVKRLFNNCRIIGRRFRLAHVYFPNGKFIEVATFRARDAVDAEAAVEEGDDLLIRDDNVFGTPEEDAIRRDFSINALFYDVDGGNVLDHAEGLSDLRRRVVRTIGDPDVRFREDPIRLLRAIKFAARLDFAIEPETLAALRRTRHEIPRAAPSRVLEEINRFCRGGAARRSFELLLEHGILDVILPEVAPFYRANPDSFALLASLLDAVDRRQARGIEVTTGMIFAALLFPTLTARLAPASQGDAPKSRGPAGRDVAEEALRPTALRLRVARKDQERCRQIVGTIDRLVPARSLRRALRQSLQRAPHMGDTLLLLEGLAETRGGEYRKALDGWLASAPGTDARAGGAAAVPAGRDSVEAPTTGGQRRRRRRGRRSGGRVEPPVAAPPSPASKKTDLPPPWDDNYFFAALPSVPNLEEEDEPADLRAESSAAEAEDEVADEAVPESGNGEAREEPSSRPRRRRRSRRRRKPAGGPGTVPPPAS